MVKDETQKCYLEKEISASLSNTRCIEHWGEYGSTFHRLVKPKCASPD